jgi:hypothetical protein
LVEVPEDRLVWHLTSAVGALAVAFIAIAIPELWLQRLITFGCVAAAAYLILYTLALFIYDNATVELGFLQSRWLSGCGRGRSGDPCRYRPIPMVRAALARLDLGRTSWVNRRFGLLSLPLLQAIRCPLQYSTATTRSSEEGVHEIAGLAQRMERGPHRHVRHIDRGLGGRRRVRG